eukprot:TRINITY_DN1526_c0_g1_i2.p1 TRINITY_DN1526_c0_g1~~TRINITY_DN1526_c0_g1_i2.p1  ORF type:complete len:553 (+),score=187.29 TRINITY_DN1526_c0_g1_i2:149-1807(+)
MGSCGSHDRGGELGASAPKPAVQRSTSHARRRSHSTFWQRTGQWTGARDPEREEEQQQRLLLQQKMQQEQLFARRDSGHTMTASRSASSPEAEQELVFVAPDDSPPERPRTVQYHSEGCLKALMEPAEHAPCCRACWSDFSILKRPHRCRGCGGRFCDSCTSLEALFAHYGPQPQRCCLSCFAKSGTAAWGGGSRQNLSSPTHVVSAESQVSSAADVHDARDMDFLSARSASEDAWVLGEQFACPAGQGRAALEMRLDSFAWFSYRRGFTLGGKVTHDTNWGCQSRCMQMMMACAMKRAMLPRSDAASPTTGSAGLGRKWSKHLLPMFRDLEHSPLSIQCVVAAAERQGVAPKEWLSPTAAAGCIAELITGAADACGKAAQRCVMAQSTVRWRLRTVVAQSGQVPVEQLRRTCDDASDEEADCALLLVPIRLGADDLNLEYTDQIQACLTLPSSCGIIAERSEQAYYVVGVTGGQVIYLDPHALVQPAFVDQRSPGCVIDPKPHSVRTDDLDPSMLLAFMCGGPQSELTVDELVADLHRINDAGPHPLFSFS